MQNWLGNAAIRLSWQHMRSNQIQPEPERQTNPSRARFLVMTGGGVWEDAAAVTEKATAVTEKEKAVWKITAV